MGRVGRPHGTEGAFHVTRPTEKWELLNSGRSLLVGGREAVVERRGGTSARPLLKLRGVESRAAAEDLRGSELEVERAEWGALAEGEYLAADLESLEVMDGQRIVGRVREVLFLPSVEALEVERPGGAMLLVPLVSDAIRRIDLAAGRVDVDLGFLDAGEAGSP